MQIERSAFEFLRGAVAWREEPDGWVRPLRFTPAQLRALGSVRAWHPGLYRQMAQCTAGIRLEFMTDATLVELDLDADPTPRGTQGVYDDVEAHAYAPRPPYDGIACVVDGKPASLEPVPDPAERSCVTFVVDDPGEVPEPGLQRLPGMGAPHTIELWLPALTGCSLKNLRCDGTYLEPVPERSTLLVLGDSIAQGFVSCDPSQSWAALVARRMGLGLVNQGVGGQVFMPGWLSDLPGELEPAAVVVELGENYRYEPCLASRVEHDIRTSLFELAEAWPNTPVWVVTPLPHTQVPYPDHPRSCYGVVPDMLRRCVAAHPQMRLVDGQALLDAEPKELARLLADGSDHPGPAGSVQIAQRLGFVIEATKKDEKTRRADAARIVRKAGSHAFPLAECLARGLGQVMVAQGSTVMLELGNQTVMLCGKDRRLVRRAFEGFGMPEGVVCVCGAKALAREVAQALGDDACANPCHLVVYEREEGLPVNGALDIRTLTPAYAQSILTAYSHPEYLAPGELEGLLASGRVLGGFEQGRLVAFVGEHADGSLGMLEVAEPARRRGWGRALLSAAVNRQLREGLRPWAEVWPNNRASLALLKGLGFTLRPAEGLWFVR